MKNIKLITSLSLALTLVLTSCSVEKRHYNKGYHVDWSSKAPKATEQTYAKAGKATVEPKAAKPITFNKTEANTTAQSAETPELTASTTQTPAKKAAKATKAPSLQANGKNTASENQSVDLKKSAKQAIKKAKDITKPTGDKSQLVALLLVIFVGVLGIHRMYLGYIGIGIIQLLTAGGCGVWALIDLIRIITGDLGPKDGSYTDTL